MNRYYKLDEFIISIYSMQKLAIILNYIGIYLCYFFLAENNTY
jgi:hypothetical protein